MSYPRRSASMNDATWAAVERNVRAGYHYFDADTMRGFGSRAHDGYGLANGSTLVVMSNRDERGNVVDGRRHYYVISVSKDGDTENVSGYSVVDGNGYWLTLASAREWAIKRSGGCE